MLLLGIGDFRKDEPTSANLATATSPWPQQAEPRYRIAKFLALMGAALFLFGAFNVYQGLRSVYWPSVEGRILYSHARGTVNPETLLWYEYYVGRRRYLGSNYRNGGNVTPFPDVAKAAAKRYPVGRTVPVYYTPGNPQDALLEPGVWWGNFVAMMLALPLFGAACVAKRYAEFMVNGKAKPPHQSIPASNQS